MKSVIEKITDVIFYIACLFAFISVFCKMCSMVYMDWIMMSNHSVILLFSCGIVVALFMCFVLHRLICLAQKKM